MGNDLDWFILRYTTDWRERLEEVKLLLVVQGTVNAAVLEDVHKRMAAHALVALGLAKWAETPTARPLEPADADALRAITFHTARLGDLRRRLQSDH